MAFLPIWVYYGQGKEMIGLHFYTRPLYRWYDDRDGKVWKLLLDDYYSNPKELLEKVLSDVPDWQTTHSMLFLFLKKMLWFASIQATSKKG